MQPESVPQLLEIVEGDAGFFGAGFGENFKGAGLDLSHPAKARAGRRNGMSNRTYFQRTNGAEKAYVTLPHALNVDAAK